MQGVQIKSKRGKAVILTLSAAWAAQSTVAWANAQKNVVNGQTDLTLAATYSPTAAATSTDDVTWTAINYSPTTFTIPSTNIVNFGTLNDLATSNITIQNGGASGSSTLILNGGSNSVSPLATDLIYQSDAARTLTIQNGGTGTLGLTLGATGTVNVAGTVDIGTSVVTAASGLTITKTGAGNLRFGANNGATNLANHVIEAGTLTNGLSNATGGTTAGGGGTITLGAASGNATATLANGNTNLNNNIIVAGGGFGTRTIVGTSNGNQGTLLGSITLNNNLTIGSGGTSTAGVRFTGSITGDGTRTITIDAGQALVRFNKDNGATLSSVINVISGTLQNENSNGTGGTVAGGGGQVNLGAASGSANATLLNGNTNFNNNIVVVAGGAGAGVRRISTATTGATAGTYRGSLTLNNDVTIGGGTTAGASAPGLNFSGNISNGSGAYVINVDAGVSTNVSPTFLRGFVNLSGTNTGFSGNVNITTGDLRVGGASALSNTASTVAIASGATRARLDLTGGAATIGGLNDISGAGGIVTITSANTRLLTVGGSGTYSFGGLLENGSGTLQLTKSGGGTQTLTGSNTYSGLTTINGGTLKVSNVSALGSSAVTLASGGTLDLNGNAIANGFGNNVTRGTLTNTGAAVNISATTITNSGSFTVDGTGNITLGIVTGGGGNAIIKNGNNTLTLTNTLDNSFLNATVNAGTLVANSTSSGSIHALFNATVSGGVLQLAGSGGDQIAGALTLTSGAFDLNGQNETVTSSVAGTGISNGGAVINSNTSTGSTLTNAVTLTADTSMGGAGNLTLANALGGGFGLTKVGNGVLTLNQANSQSSTTVNAGTLKMGNASALGATTNPLTVNGGTLDLNNNSLTVGALSGSGGTISSSVAGTVTLTANSASSSSFTGTITNSSATTLNLTKNGAGTLALGAANGYNGVTTISNGTLSVGTLANGGVASSIGQSTSAASNLVLNGGGTLSYTGGSVSTDRNLTVGSSGGTINVSDAAATLTVAQASVGTNTLTKTGPGAITFSSGVVGSNTGASINVSGGTATLSGASDNSYLGASVTSGTLVLNVTSTGSVHALGGNTTIGAGGTLQLSGSGNDQIFYQADVAVNASGATFDLNGKLEQINGFSGVTGALVTNTNITASELQVGANNATSSYSGIIQNGAGSVAFTKQGIGTQTLSGSNSYSGATNVAAGTLIIDGNQTAATGLATVSNGATLKGSGTVGGGVTVNSGATLSPGNSPGIFTMGGNLAQAGTYVWEFDNGVSTGAAGTNYDQIVQIGASATTTISAGILNVSLSSGDYTGSFWDANRSWKIIDVANTANTNASFASITSTVATAGEGAFTTILGSGADAGDVFLNWTTTAVGNTIKLSASTGSSIADNTNSSENPGSTSAGNVHIAGSGTNYISEVDGLTGNANAGAVSVDNTLGGNIPVYVMIWTEGDVLATNAIGVTNGIQIASGTDQWNDLQAQYGLGGIAGNNFEYLFQFTNNPFSGGTGAVEWNFGADAGLKVDRIAVVPEPASLGLIGAGALLMASRRRRRNARA